MIYSQNYDLKRFGDESAEFIKSPLNWNEKDLLKFGLIAAAGTGLLFIDEEVKSFSQKDIPDEFYIPSEIGRIWGEFYLSAGMSALFLIHGTAANNEANKKLGFEIAQTFTYSVAAVGIIKISLGRARPRITDDAWEYNPFYFSTNDYWSMPSGHNALAFSLSTVISNSFSSDGLKIISYLPAALTFFSRIYQNHHWISDAFIGASLGYFIGKFVTNLHKEENIGQELSNDSFPVFSISLAL